MLDDDRQKLIEYYQQHGFFEVRVTPGRVRARSLGTIDLTFVIYEGNAILGPRRDHRGKYQDQDRPCCKDDLELHSGKPFLQAVRDADKKRMLIKYNEIGCIDTQIVVEPRWTNKPGVVDLVYKIEEEEPYLLGELKIQGNRADPGQGDPSRGGAGRPVAGRGPGQEPDRHVPEAAGGAGVFHERSAGQTGKQIKIEIVDRRPKDKPYGDLMMPLIGETTQARMQDPGGDQPSPLPVPDAPPPLAAAGPERPRVRGPGLFNARRIRSARRPRPCRRSTCRRRHPP